MDDIFNMPRADEDTPTRPMWRQVGPEARTLDQQNFRANRTLRQAWDDGLDSTVFALGARNVRQRVNTDDPFIKQAGQALMALTGQAGRWGESTWDRAEHFEELTKRVPREYWEDIFLQNSIEGARITEQNIVDEMARAERIGMSHGAAYLMSTAGMLMDVDVPLVFASGGSVASAKVAGAAAYAARRTGASMGASRRVAGVAAGLSGGAQAGALVGAGLTLQSDTHDWIDGVSLMLSTTAFGGTLGAIAPSIAFSMQRAHTDFLRRVREGDPELWDEFKPAMEPASAPPIPDQLQITQRPVPMETPDVPADFGSQGMRRDLSAAANEVPATPVFPALKDPLGMSATDVGWIQSSRDRVLSGNFREQVAERRENFIDRLGASKAFTVPSGNNDWFRLVRSESSVLNRLAMDVFESASGYVRGSTANAGQLLNMYTGALNTHIRNLDRHAVDWANSQGNRGYAVGVTPFGMEKSVQAAFYREVQLYINAKSLGRAHPTPHKSVMAAAEDVRRMGNEAAHMMKGKPGQHAVDGAENLPTDGWWSPQRWDGSRIAGLITQGGKPMREKITNAIADGYTNTGLITDRQLAQAMANALVDRFVSRGARLDDSVMNLFSGDGREYLRQNLRNTLSEAEVENIMRRFDNEMAERGKMSSLKRRNDIDLSTAIPDTNFQLIDLLRQDYDNVLNTYTREVAGQSALARQGIRSRKDIEDIISAARSEQRALGEEELDPDFLRAMFADFNGGPQWGYGAFSGRVNKGVGDAIATAKAATSLSVLTFNGAAQLAETGVVVLGTGMNNFVNRAIAPIVDKAIRDGNKALLNEIEQFGFVVGRDHEIMKPHLAMDDANAMRFHSSDVRNVMRRVRETVGKGNYIQGYTSMLNAIRSWQQRAMVLGVGDKVMKMVRAGDIAQFDINGRAFRDLGFNTQQFYDLQDALKNVEWADGPTGPYVKAFNFANWRDDQLVEDFLSGLSRSMDQGVQRSLPGETSRWMHTEVGTLATHLKTFPMLAIQKQFVRNMSYNDAQAYGTIMAAFTSAYTAMWLRDKLTGREREPSELVRAAVGYSNITGWMPMVWDPLISALGMPELRANTFGPYSSPLEVPTLNTLNNLVRAPGGVWNVLQGTASWNDVQATRQLPFVRLAESAGRMAGIELIDRPRNTPSAARESTQLSSDQLLRSTLDEPETVQENLQ